MMFGWRWADRPGAWPVLRILCYVGLHNVSCRGRYDHLTPSDPEASGESDA